MTEPDVPALVTASAPGAAPARRAAAATYVPRHVRQAMTDADRRAAAQQPLAARSARIGAYAASLEVALAASPRGERAIVLERRLRQARQDLAAAARSQLAVPTPPAARSHAARTHEETRSGQV